MKLWIDDVREPPGGIHDGYMWIKSVNAAKMYLIMHEYNRLVGAVNYKIELIDIDHDAGDYANDGGDYIKLLDWFEEKGFNYPIRIHSQNPVGVENMRRIIRRNNWKEVF